MLYVLYVRGGGELRIAEELRRKGIAAYCPRQIKAERRRGEWVYVERVVFGGYIFIAAEELSPALWHKTMRCAGVIRFVSLSPLPKSEAEYIGTLCESGCIEPSRGYILDGELHITSGFLLGKEYVVTKFNRRGRRASADVTLYGKHYKIVFSVEYDDPPVPCVISSAGNET